MLVEAAGVLEDGRCYCFVLPGRVQKVEIALFAPGLVDANGPVWGEDDVAAEDVPAVTVPDVWVEGVGRHYVVFDDAIEAFAVLDSAV